MPFSRCPRSRIAAHLALTAIFTAAPALAQSKPALSLDESLQITIARSRDRARSSRRTRRCCRCSSFLPRIC